MKVLDRYVIKELFVPFVMDTIVIALLFVANEFIAIFKNFELSGVPWTAVLQMVALRMPEWLSMTLPTGTAMGAALAISRLARESEVVAMKASGVSVRRLLIPLIIAGTAVSLGNFLVVEKLMPPAAQQYSKLRQKFFLAAAAPRMQSNVMIQLGKYAANFASVRRESGKLFLDDILLIERPKSGEIAILTAKQGIYEDGIWTLDDAFLRMVQGNKLLSASTKQKVQINERIRIEDVFGLPEPRQETTETLRKAIDRAKALGQSTTELEVAYHVKYSLPASCLLFAVTSGLVALVLARAGPFVGVLVSLVLVMLYFNAYIISTEIIGRNGWLSPAMSAWLPNLACAIVALAALRRAE